MTRRIVRIGRDDEIGALLTSVNRLLDLTESFAKEAGSAMLHAGRKEFYRTIPESGMKGEFLTYARRINGVMADMDHHASEAAAVAEVAAIVSAAAHGDLDRRIQLGGKDGFLLDLCASVNDLLSQTAIALKDFARVLAAVAQGDLTTRMEVLPELLEQGWHVGNVVQGHAADDEVVGATQICAPIHVQVLELNPKALGLRLGFQGAQHPSGGIRAGD